MYSVDPIEDGSGDKPGGSDLPAGKAQGAKLPDLPDAEDREQAVQEDGSEPLPSLYRIDQRHIAYVMASISRLGVTCVQDRQDLLQEVLLQGHLSRHSPIEPRALLSGITHHVVLRWRKKRRNRAVAIAGFLDTQAEPHIEPGAEEESHAAAERIEILHEAIDELAPMFREVLVRNQLDGASIAEIATEADIPESTGHTRLHIARIRLAQVLRRKMARRGLQKGDL